MIVDSSAFIAILRNEPEAEFFLRKMAQDRVFVSAATLAEIQIVIRSKFKGDIQSALEQFKRILSEVDAKVLPFDGEAAEIAGTAFEKFGKRNHPANLNFGDCMSYAAAKQSGEPLLFKGEDFMQTDIVAA